MPCPLFFKQKHFYSLSIAGVEKLLAVQSSWSPSSHLQLLCFFYVFACRKLEVSFHMFFALSTALQYNLVVNLHFWQVFTRFLSSELSFTADRTLFCFIKYELNGNINLRIFDFCLILGSFSFESFYLHYLILLKPF